MASTGASAELLVVGLGATEQHGPHLPLDTDTVIADALCRGLASRLPVRVAPVLPYGSSGEHADFAGTLSIGQEALSLVLVELARSYDGPVLFVCAHGGNAEPVAAALRRVENARAWFPRWGGDAHAGRTETSLMLALAPVARRPGATGRQRRAAVRSAAAPARRGRPRRRRRTACSATRRARRPKRAARCSPRRSTTSSRSSIRGVFATATRGKAVQGPARRVRADAAGTRDAAEAAA